MYKEYALYKGEDFITVGTIEEIAKTEGVKKETIKFYGTKAYRDRLKNRNTKKARVLILLD